MSLSLSLCLLKELAVKYSCEIQNPKPYEGFGSCITCSPGIEICVVLGTQFTCLTKPPQLTPENCHKYVCPDGASCRLDSFVKYIPQATCSFGTSPYPTFKAGVKVANLDNRESIILNKLFNDNDILRHEIAKLLSTSEYPSTQTIYSIGDIFARKFLTNSHEHLELKISRRG